MLTTEVLRCGAIGLTVVLTRLKAISPAMSNDAPTTASTSAVPTRTEGDSANTGNS